MKVKRNSLDRISDLPQDTIEKILTLIPIRDAVRTSILSKKWRYSWTTIPKLVFDVNLVVSSRNEEVDKYKFVNAVLQVLLLHKAPILEFGLFVDKENFREMDQIILHLSRSNDIKKFTFEFDLYGGTYKLPCSFFSLKGLEHIDLSYCTFEPPSMNMGFSMLKSLRFNHGDITNKMVFEFLTNCPILEKFTWIGYYEVELTECELVELFKCLPSVQVLEIFKLNIKLSTVLCVISSCPNLEKIKLKMCGNHDRRCIVQQAYDNLPNIQEYSGVNLDHLKELEITNFHNEALETEFVKLIMAKSPVLKKARIVVSCYVYVDEEVKMLRGLVNTPYPRASPAVSFTIGRQRKCLG